MPEPTQFTIGTEVSCTDGPCGAVTKVVVNPVAQTVTHLVVEPKHRAGLGRLVPLHLVAALDRRAPSQLYDGRVRTARDRRRNPVPARDRLRRIPGRSDDVDALLRQPRHHRPRQHHTGCDPGHAPSGRGGGAPR